MRPIEIDEASRLHLAFAARSNAAELLKAAELLFAAGFYGYALSLAITSREEQGKFIQHLSALVSASPRTLAPRVPHKHKQAAGIYLAALAKLLDPARFSVDLRSHDLANAEQLLDAIGSSIVSALTEIDLQPHSVEAMKELVDLAASGSDDQRRQAGLYVDPVDDAEGCAVRTPQDVSREEAEAEIKASGRFFSFSADAEDQIQLSSEAEALPAPEPELFLRWMRDLAAQFGTSPPPDAQATPAL